MDAFLLLHGGLPDGMLGILGALKQAIQDAVFFLARAFWVSFLTVQLYVIKPLVLRTPVPTQFTFFSGNDAYLYYDPSISGPDGLIQQFYQKTSVLAGFAMTLGIIFSGFLLGMGIANDNWMASARDNLRRLLFMAPWIYLAIYLLQFTAELSAMTTSMFLDENTYNDFLVKLPQLIINPGTPSFSDEVGLILGIALTSIILFLVLLELVMRFAIMVFIPAISPLLVTLMVFHWSRPMASAAMRLYVTAAFFQPAVAICLNFTITMVLQMRGGSNGVAGWAIMAGCASLMAYLPKVLSGVGSNLSQAAQGMKTAAVATVATVALSAGAATAVAGKAVSGAASAAAGARGGFGAISGGLQQGGSWAAKAGQRTRQFGQFNLKRMAEDAGGLALALPPARPAAKAGGAQAAPRPTAPRPGDGTPTPDTSSPALAPAVSTPALGRTDRAAYGAGFALRRLLKPDTPTAGEALAGSAGSLPELEASLRQWPTVPAPLAKVVRDAKRNPALASRANQLLAAPDAATFHQIHQETVQDPILSKSAKQAFLGLAGLSAAGRGFGSSYATAQPGPSVEAASRYAGTLGPDAARLLAETEAHQGVPSAAAAQRVTAGSISLARRSIYYSAAATGTSQIASDAAADSWGSAELDGNVREATRQVQALEQVILGLQRTAHSTMRSAAPESLTPRQPAAVRDSLVAGGHAAQLAEVEPFLRQVEAGKYDANANRAVDDYLAGHPEVVRAVGLRSPSVEALTPEQARHLLERAPDLRAEPRQVVVQVASGDQDNASLRAYRGLQVRLAAAPEPAQADVRVVTSFPRRLEESALTQAPTSSRADVEHALAAIRREAAGIGQVAAEEARQAASQALEAAARAHASVPRPGLK